MPELTIKVKWPDQDIQELYSPSSVVEQYFEVGEKMTVSDFVNTGTEALQHASRRVEEKFGFACTSAMASIQHIVGKSKEGFEQEDLIEILDVS